jgi:pyruvate formate lyase activating enzyme
MRIGGLQKHSLIDYPGRMSCVLFLAGCNFDCPYCHNPGLARGRCAQENGPSEADFFSFLERRRGFLDGVVVSGGEPTLSSDLIPTCERIKTMGYPVKLDTNGSRPAVLQDLLDLGLVDYVAMDIKTDPFHYEVLAHDACSPSEILTSIQLIMDRCETYEFRTTCVRPLVSEKTVEKVVQLIQGARRYVLQRFRPAEMLHPEFFQDMDPAFSPEELRELHAQASPWVEECILR